LTEVVTGREEVASTVGRPYRPTVQRSALLLSRCPALLLSLISHSTFIPLSLRSDSFTPLVLFAKHPFTPSTGQPVTFHAFIPLRFASSHPDLLTETFHRPAVFQDVMPFFRLVVHAGVHPGSQKHSSCKWSHALDDIVCFVSGCPVQSSTSTVPSSPKFQCWKMAPRGTRPRHLKNTHSRQRVGRTIRVNIEIWGEGCVPLA